MAPPAPESPVDTFAPLQPAPPTKPRVWTLVAATALAALSTVLFSLAVCGVFVLQMVVRYRAEHGTAPNAAAVMRAAEAMIRTPAGLVGSGLASCLSFAFFALVPASLSPEGYAARLRLKYHPWWFAWGLLGAVGLAGIGMLSSGVVALLGRENTGALGVIARALSHLDAPMTATALAVIGLGAGLGEELFFRGYLLTRLAERWRPWVAVAVTAALFGLAHMDVLHSSFALLVGVLLGWVSLRTGSIRATIVAHAVNNAVGVLAMALSSGPETTSRGAATAQVAVGIALTAACVAGFARGRFEEGSRSP